MLYITKQNHAVNFTNSRALYFYSMMLATSAASRLPFFYREIFYSALLFRHQSRGVFQKAGYVTYPGKFEDQLSVPKS